MTGKGALPDRAKAASVIGNGKLRLIRHIEGEIA
jgi:hypothetical protein